MRRRKSKGRKKPYTTDELAKLLARYPKGTKVYVGGGGFAFKPNSVHWGNEYSDERAREFVTVEDVSP